jgi:hypothetical protein
MLQGSGERFIPVPDGEAGSIATLHRMATLIRTPDPWVDDFTDILSQASDDPVELARLVFEWVRSKMLYTPDRNDSDILDEIREPGYLLREIDRYGAALGDCDDYVVLYGALYSRLGYPFTLEAISRHDDQMLDHVYGSILVNGVRIAVDGIVEFPFGWEVPADEVTYRITLAA